MRSFLIYLTRRLAISVALLVVMSIVIFILLRVIPGNPVLAILGGTVKGVSQQQLHALKGQLGLNRALPAQYLSWILGAAHGSFGRSYVNDFPVSTLILQRAGATVQLAIGAIAIGILLAIGLAVSADSWRSRVYDGAVSGFTGFAMSVPTFVIGIILIILFGLSFHLLPSQGYVSIMKNPVEGLRTTVLPAVTLGVGLSGPLLRLLRASMREVRSMLFVRTAAGKGLTPAKIVFRHVFPNALLPALNAFGIVLGSLLGGTVVVEYVFARPGLGTLLLSAIEGRNYPVVQALVLLAVVFFLCASFLVDVVSALIDPRLRVRGA